MASMKETELYIGTRSNKKGRLKIAYMKSKASGVTFNIKDDIKGTLVDLHSKDKLRTFKSTFLDKQKEAWAALNRGSNEQKVEAIGVFLRALGTDLGNGLSPINISDALISKTIEDIKGFLDATIALISNDHDTDTDADIAEAEVGAHVAKDTYKGISE